jgi:hypothetical protein
VEGEDAARAHSLSVKGLPAGTYVVQVRLERSGGDRLLEELTLEVKGDPDRASGRPRR